MKKKNKNRARSKCCNARVVIRGKSTMWHECIKCHTPCDITCAERRTWEINPVTRVAPNTKKKKLDKIIKDEIRYLLGG